MIERFEIRNYRSILGRGPHGSGTPAELDIEDDITTLIGKNEAGKSNLLRGMNRFGIQSPLPRSELSNYGDYTDITSRIELLRCRLTSGALNEDDEKAKPVPWLLGPYRPDDLDGFPARIKFEDIELPVDSDPEHATPVLGNALATGHVEVIHYDSGSHAIDIIGRGGGDSESDFPDPDQLDLPFEIEDFIAKRFHEHLRLCWWFVQNIIEVSKLNHEIEEVRSIDPDAVDNISDLNEEIRQRLDRISNVFNDAEPIETPPEITQEDAEFSPPDIFAIQQTADNLLRTLSNVDNPTDPIDDLPTIVDQSEIELVESEYNLIADGDDPILQGLLALGDIHIIDYNSYDSSEFQDALDTAVNELSKYLNAFWDFRPEERRPQETVTPDQTERYSFQYELNGTTLALKLAEGDNPPTPLDQRSDGMRWIITFLMTIVAQPYEQSEGRQTLLTLDDPGIHLHPEAEKKLYRAFFYVVNQAQIVYTTHSPALIDRKEIDRLRIVEHEIEGDGPVGTTVVNNLDEARAAGKQVDPLATAREAIGWTLSDSLFQGEQTVLVEGSSDKRYLNMFNSFFNWSGRPCLADDPTFVDSKGGQLPFLSRILAAENVTHVALMDDDSSTNDYEPELEERTVRYNEVGVLDGKEYDAEIEDLFNRRFMIELASEVHDDLDAEDILETPYDTAPTGIVDYIENFLDGKELNKGKLSREVRDQLQPELRESPEAHQDTIERFQTVISELKETLERVDREQFGS